MSETNMNDQTKFFITTLRIRNHDLISANQQLIAAITRIEEQRTEQERYIQYLERIINENGWNPAKEKTC